MELGERLDRLVPEVRPGARYPVLVQVNVDLDPAKHGFGPADVDAALAALLTLPNLEVRGLMTVGRLTTDQTGARQTFRELRDLSTRLRERSPGSRAQTCRWA